MTDINELLVNASNVFMQGNYNEALSIYLNILSRNFNESSIHGNLGMTYEMLGEYELAVAHYKKSIRLNESNVRSVDNLARVYINLLKDFEIASQYLDHAIKIAPNDAEAYNLYGNLCYLKQDYEKAERYFNKSIQLDKDFFKNYYDLAITLKSQKKNKEALEAAKKSHELRPDYVDAINLIKELETIQ